MNGATRTTKFNSARPRRIINMEFSRQDNWKATPKLTLNLGLRYDVTLPRTDRYNRQNYFNPNVTEPSEQRKLHLYRSGERRRRHEESGRRRGFRFPQSPQELHDGLVRLSAAFRFCVSVRSEDGRTGRLRNLLRAIAVRSYGSRAVRRSGLQPVHECDSHLSESWRHSVAAPG